MIALLFVRVDVQGESAKAVIQSRVHTHVAERLAQLFSDDRVLLDPGFKEAIDLLDA